MPDLDYATVAKVLSRHIRNVDKLLAATADVLAIDRNDLSTHALRVQFLRSDPRAQQMLAAGKWIPAIKLLREVTMERTGQVCSLVAAKEALDEFRNADD